MSDFQGCSQNLLRPEDNLSERFRARLGVFLYVRSSSMTSDVRLWKFATGTGVAAWGSLSTIFPQGQGNLLIIGSCGDG